MKNNLSFSKIAACLIVLMLPAWLAAQQNPPTPIAYGQSITDTINYASEAEIFEVNAAVGDILWVRVAPVGLFLTPKVEILTPQGGLFAMASTNSYNTMVEIRKTIPANGTGVYTILVSDSGANGAGSFCISVERFNSPPTAQLIQCNSSLTNSSICNTSVKTFRYIVQQNAQTRIIVTPQGLFLTPRVWICAPDGTIIAQDSTNSYNQAITINVTAAQTDCYYVLVADTGGNGTGEFSISNNLIFGECGTATIQTTPADGSVCEGSSFTLTANTPLPNPSFLWSGPNGFTSTQQTINIAGATFDHAGTYTVTVTNASNCASTSSKTIVAKPLPTMNEPADRTVCGGTTLNVTFSGTSGSTFHWTNSNPDIGLAASGTGNLSFTTANHPVQQNAVIAVTPMLNGCSGTSHEFTIDINPTPILADPPNQTVCGGILLNISFVSLPTATSYAWTNSNTAIGLGASGSGNIAFTTAALASQQTGIITVEPTLNNCVGAAQNFNITVRQTPTMTNPGDKTVCGGTALSVAFAGTPGATFHWTNSNPGIGLAASGTGNLNFVTANDTVSQNATITVTPSLNGCDGAAQEFHITVNPTPTMSKPEDQTVCGGDVLNVDFAGTPFGTTFTWTNSNPSIGLVASGTGNIAFVANNLISQQIGTVTATPTLGGCPGTPQTFKITVNPTPAMSPQTDKSFCPDIAASVNFSSTPTGANFTWTNSNPAIGLAGSGSGNIAFIVANVSSTETGLISVTPALAGCVGATQYFNIIVKPKPSMTNPDSKEVCAAELVSVNFASTPSGANFTWTNSNPAIGLSTSGSGNIAFIAANVVSLQTGTITSTPILDGCEGTPQAFNITVMPKPVASFVVADISGTTATFSNQSSNANSYFWNFGDGSTSTAQNPEHQYSTGGTYTVALTVTSDCGTDVFTQQVTVMTIGINDADWVEIFNLFPNPNNGIFTVHLTGIPTEQLDFELFDLTGRILGKQTLRFNTGELTHTFDFGDLPAAMYMLRVQADEQVLFAKVLIE